MTAPVFEHVEIGGVTYIPQFDKDRLNAQQKRVYRVMRDCEWRTLREIEQITDDPQPSISARLRDLRKMGLVVERRRRGDPRKGLHEYRVLGR